MLTSLKMRILTIHMIRLEIRNAELTESRLSKSARSESGSNLERPEEEVVETEAGEMTEEQDEEEVKTEEGNDLRRGRLSIALTNCGDVLERQLFDAIFWSAPSFRAFENPTKSGVLYQDHYIIF